MTSPALRASRAGPNNRSGLGEGRPLVLPEQRQVETLESLGGERDRLGAVENALDQIRGQKGQLQRSRDVADVRTFAKGDVADGEILVRIEVNRSTTARLDQVSD